MTMGNHSNPKLTDETLSALISSRKHFHSFLTKRVESHELAEDLLQNAIRKAIENPTSSTNERTIVVWFYQILKNVLIDHYRASAAEKRKYNHFVHEMEHAIEIPDEIEAEICKCMSELLPTLKREYAVIIKKVDFEQQPIGQIAAELNTNTNNLTVRLRRARQALKASLEVTCGVCTKHGCLNCTCK